MVELGVLGVLSHRWVYKPLRRAVSEIQSFTATCTATVYA